MAEGVSRWRIWFFGLALCLSSAGGLVIEIVAGRLIAPYVGMSLYTWTAVIAVVLAGLSVGHWLGGQMAGPGVDAATGTRRLALSLALAAVSSLAALVLIRVISGPLLQSGLAQVPVIIVLTGALFLLPSLFVGIVAPIITKLAVDARPDAPGPVIGQMYALGTLGSIAGTLAAGYVMISWIGSIGTVLAVAGVYAALAVAFMVIERRRAPEIGMLLAVVAGAGLVGAWGSTKQAFTSPCTVESDYFCIRIDDFSASSGRPSTLMALDHLVHSINDRDDPGLLYSPYIHFVDELTKRRFTDRGDKPFSAFFIGGGGFSLPRAWAVDYAGARLTVAEVDPAVTEAARRFMWFDPAAGGLDIHHRDARALLQSTAAEPAFHVVFGDAFHDISIPAHLVTREFHAEIAARLNGDGFYAVNVVDQDADPKFLMALVKTLRLDFAAVEVWAEAEELMAARSGETRRVTYVVVAQQRPTSANRIRARRGIERTWLRWPAADLERRLLAADAPTLTDDFAPVDRLMAGLLLEGEPEH